MAVLTIYEEFASGGREIGKLLANKLGYEYVDKGLFQKIAEDLHVSESTLESFEKSRQYRIPNLFSNMFSKNYIQRIVGYDKSVIEEREYQQSLKNLIQGIAKEDNVVILGRAAHCFLKGMPNCFPLRVVAPREWRKRYAVDKLNLPADQIHTILERRDANQVWFHRSICGEDHENPKLFYLTINTGFVPIEAAVEMAIMTLGKNK